MGYLKKNKYRLSVILMSLMVLAASCTGNRKVKHAEFPNTITVKKTDAHLQVPGTKFFVIPPIGFTKKKFEATYAEREGSLEFFSISQTVKGVKLPITIEDIKKENEKDGEKTIAIKPVLYNGMAGVYNETLSMNKFYKMEIRVLLKDNTILFIQGNFTYQSKPETVDKIVTAMQNALYEDVFVVDYVKDANYQLSDKDSPFKFTGKDYKMPYFYTINGKGCNDGCSLPYLTFFQSMKIVSDGSGKPVYDSRGDDLFPSYTEALKNGGYNLKLKTGTPVTFMQGGRKAREMLLEGTDPNGEMVVLLLTEVNNESAVIVSIGFAKPGDEKSIEEFRKLAATLTIRE